MNYQLSTPHSQAFLTYLEEWLSSLLSASLQEIASNPAATALLTVDVTEGFCNQGALSSPRVKAIVAPIVDLMKLAHKHGIKHYLLPQDTHEAEAVEFGAFPPHCTRGSEESETVSEIKSLPFYDQMVVLPKNSINSQYNTGLGEWIAQHPEVDTFIVTGDCTDLCVYQLAMFLRIEANAYQQKRRVIIPENCVDTYDRTVEAAQEEGGFPHDADLLHAVFLNHMALNGVEVVKQIQ